MSSGADTAVMPATNALTIAFLPASVASAASEVNRSLMTEKGLVDSGGAGAIASRKALSSMLATSSLPADSCTGGTWTSACGATIGLATTTPAAANATPVVKIGPYVLRTAPHLAFGTQLSIPESNLIRKN